MSLADPTSLLALLDHPDTLRVRKRPVPVHVAFADADGTCETLEGPVRYRAGDALLTGGEGERWPVWRADFDAAYRAVADGAYIKRVAAARARRLDTTTSVPVGRQSDRLKGAPGDWLLRYEDGTFGVVRDDIFRKTYEPDENESRWPPPEPLT